jgi:hypothetical protein
MGLMQGKSGTLYGKSRDTVYADYKKRAAEGTFSEQGPDPDSELACMKAMRFDHTTNDWMLTYWFIA